MRNWLKHFKIITLFFSCTVLLVAPASSMTIVNYTNFPKSYSNYNLGILSPVIGDLDPTSLGNEIVTLKNYGSHMSSTRLVIYYSDGSSVEKWISSARTYSSPAIAELDNNSSNGLEIVFSEGINLSSTITLKAFYSNGSLYWSRSLGGRGTTPAIGDLDNDGSPEIVIGEGSNIGVYYSNSTKKFSYSVGGSTSSAPSLADLDDDGFLEIVAITDGGDVFVIKKDGSTHWSDSTGYQISTSSPAIGDIDNDGYLEIVVATKKNLFAWHHNGSRVSGFPVSAANSGSSPALGDLDNDGDLEIVIGVFSGSDNLAAWNYDGTVFFKTTVSTYNVGSSPVIIDLDGDGLLETIIAYWHKSEKYSELAIVDYDGNILDTLELDGTVSLSAPAVGDVDEDDRPEIAFLTEGSGGKIYLFTISDGNYSIEKTPWPMYNRDAENRGMHSPVARVISPSSASYSKGSSVFFSGSGLSVDGDLSYSWTSNGTQIGSSKSFTKSDLSTGTHIIKLKVTDTEGRMDESAPVTLNIINLPTSVNITSPIDGALFETGENITFSGSASDPDGTITSISWKANSTVIYTNTSVNQQTINISFDYGDLTSGSYVISFTVTDDEGVVDTDQFTIKVSDPPTVAIITPSSGSFFTRGRTVTFAGSATDPDGSITSYRWTADGSFLSDSKSFATSFSSVGIKTINFEATDEDGIKKSSSIDIIIKSPPVSTTVEFVPPITEDIPTIFDKRGFLTEDDFMETIEDLGHMNGKKYSFDTPTSPLASAYASKGEVVLHEKQIDSIWSSLHGFEEDLHKMSGIDIYSAAALYALEHYTDFSNLIITRGDLNVDSLAAAPLARILDAPILLVRPNEIPRDDLPILEKMQGGGRIYIIGGVEAISDDVEEELNKYAGTVVRVGGATRYETSLEIAEQIEILTDTGTAVSVRGDEPYLYAATIGVKYGAPIIYLDRPFSTLGASSDDLDIHQKSVVEFISEKFTSVGELYFKST